MPISMRPPSTLCLPVAPSREREPSLEAGGEPYLDANSDGLHNVGEFFVDWNSNGVARRCDYFL